MVDSLRVIIDHLLTVAGFLLALTLVLRVLGERRQPGGAMAWLLAILLIPYIGVPLYLLLGGRKLARQASRKNPLYDAERGELHLVEETFFQGGRRLVQAGMPPPRSGNRVELVFNGEKAFHRLMEDIAAAKESIYIETFILGRDETGRAVVDALARKAREGVDVRLLLDGLGCLRSKGRFAQPIRDAGGHVAEFLPVLPLRRKWSANLRNHRKIVVVDHTRAMVGGMNLAREFMGPMPWEGRFVDACAFVTGPVVGDIEQVFASDWEFATDMNTPIPDSPLQADTAEHALSTLQLAASGPDVPEDTFHDALLSAIMDARERVWIVTPYFVPDDAALKLLALKARAGKDVRLIVPWRSNHRLTDYARGPALRQLIAAGARVYVYPHGMVHAKVMVFDHLLAITGTPNLDMRSLYFNYEVALFHYTRGDIDEVTSWVTWLAGQSLRVTGARVGRARYWLENLCNLLSPLL